VIFRSVPSRMTCDSVSDVATATYPASCCVFALGRGVRAGWRECRVHGNVILSCAVQGARRGLRGRFRVQMKSIAGPCTRTFMISEPASQQVSEEEREEVVEGGRERVR
jgi:hypothetical protein